MLPIGARLCTGLYLFCQAECVSVIAPLMACDSDAALCGEEVAARHWAPEPPVTFSLVVNQKLPA